MKRVNHLGHVRWFLRSYQSLHRCDVKIKSTTERHQFTPSTKAIEPANTLRLHRKVCKERFHHLRIDHGRGGAKKIQCGLPGIQNNVVFLSFVALVCKFRRARCFNILTERFATATIVIDMLECVDQKSAARHLNFRLMKMECTTLKHL